MEGLPVFYLEQMIRQEFNCHFHIDQITPRDHTQRYLTKVIKYANMSNMKYTIEYFHARVQNDIERWPDGILADYARLVELLMEFGPNLRMPHSRAMGDGLFELRPRGREASVVHYIASLWVSAS